MKHRYLFKHHCPHLDKPHAITIEYAEINLLGDPKTHYKIIGYSCDYSDNCPYPSKDEYGRCPVFLAAPNEPI